MLKIRRWRQITALCVALGAQSALAENVVGLREAYEDVYFAVRGLVPAGTVVSGVEFYSNDGTLFPEVFLARDASGGRLPRPDGALRSVVAVQGSRGVVTVSFPRYEAREDEYLWAVVRFPDNVALVADGAGGGPGIGWRAQRLLREERSFFGVRGHMNEWSPAFDINVLSSGPAASKAGSVPNNGRQEGGEWSGVRVETRVNGEGVIFLFSVAKGSAVQVDVFDVAGRRIAHLPLQTCSPGDCSATWDGRSLQGRKAASGLYLYRLRIEARERRGKFVYLR